MNYVATVGEREFRIRVEEVGVARYRVTIDGTEHLVDAHQVQESVWSVLYGNDAFSVDVQGTEDDREVLILRQWDGLSFDEIGKRLEISTSAARVRHLRAVRRLAREVEELRRGAVDPDPER